MYSGCTALAASNAAKFGVRFLAFDTVRGKLDALAGTSGQPRATWINVVSGWNAGVAESILVDTPGDAVKTKMTHAASSSNGDHTQSAVLLVLPGSCSTRGYQGPTERVSPQFFANKQQTVQLGFPHLPCFKSELPSGGQS